MSREKDLEFLRGNLAYLFQLLVLIKELRGELCDRMGQNLRKLLTSSVVRNFLLGLANLLDPAIDSQGNKNISIHVLDIDLGVYDEVVRKIKVFRSKAIAHNDQTAMHQGDAFFTQSGLMPEQVETLLNYMITCLEKEIDSPFSKEDAAGKVLSELAQLID